ncbi:MBL fold metallo-hydrolase [Haloarcula sp. JP-L23]|uniref:MBL fold metallo-hydrolase n=1 Tax=Haloarcula sp. JP-L23 TaxID=2716717 RepID=UPI00140F28B6|nr:MBL fold metallo-hydrolase [Haloarcula sp. JP-L23]
MSVTEVSDGVYTIQFDHVRVFVLEDRPQGNITLVDTAFPDDGDELVQILEAEFRSVDRVVITHDDEGHLGGTPAVVDRFDPELVVPGGAKGFYEALDLEADTHMSHGDVLEGALRVLEIPGHTAATSGLLLENENILIAGDILEGSDRRGLPPGYLVPPAEQFNDFSHAAAERNLTRLFDYTIDTVLVSHGSHVYDDPLEKLNDWLLDREWELTL